MRSGYPKGFVAPKMALVSRKHSALNSKAVPVTEADWPGLRRILPRALKSFQDRGYALALPQVGISKQGIIMNDGTFWVNPSLEILDDKVEDGEEGCLSLPGRTFLVSRFLRVKVKAQLLGETNVEEWVTETPLEARIWQHEMDHLAGQLLAGRFKEIKPS